IISADTVSLLAAVALYLLSIGSVRGFAFTLGLSTLLDPGVVFLFTHPLVAILVRRPVVSTSRFTPRRTPTTGGTAAGPPSRRARCGGRAGRRLRPGPGPDTAAGRAGDQPGDRGDLVTVPGTAERGQRLDRRCLLGFVDHQEGVAGARGLPAGGDPVHLGPVR